MIGRKNRSIVAAGSAQNSRCRLDGLDWVVWIEAERRRPSVLSAGRRSRSPGAFATGLARRPLKRRDRQAEQGTALGRLRNRASALQ